MGHALLHPPWTPETAPRNGGRPKGSRDRIATRLMEATAAFLEGDETHPAYDFTAWLRKLADSGNPTDAATLARFLAQFVPQDVKVEASLTHAALVSQAGAVPPAVVEAAMVAWRAHEEAKRLEETTVIDVPSEVRAQPTEAQA